jgi:hypothetical protein
MAVSPLKRNGYQFKTLLLKSNLKTRIRTLTLTNPNPN